MPGSGTKATAFDRLLIELDACGEAQQWSRGKSLATVWATCERGDWLLWLCGRMVDKKGWPTRQQLVLAACACAEPALKYVKTGEDWPHIAIATAIRWANGKATIKEVRDAANAANAADAADAAAAYAAAYAAYSAYAADAADAADYAANAAAYADAADAAISLKQSADIVRSIIKCPRMVE